MVGAYTLHQGTPAMTLAELRQKMNAALATANAIEAKAKDEKRDLTEEESTQFDAALGEAEAAQAEIAKQSGAEARQARQARLAAALKPRSVARTSNADEPAPVAKVKELASEDPKRGFKTPREFMMAVMGAHQDPTAELDRRLAPLQVDAKGTILATAGSDEHGAYTDPYGGFLIPAGFSTNLLSVMGEGDPTAGRTTQIPMTSPTVKIPARTDKDHTTSVTGGLRFFRRAETDTAASSRMQMEQIVLQANGLMGKAYATEELLTDSLISFVALLEAGFRDEYAGHMLNEKLNGSGVGCYEGALQSPAKVEVAKETGQAADTLVINNVLNMRARAWRYSNAIWLANHDTFPQLAKLVIPAGTGGAGLAWQQSMVEGSPDMLLGRPIFFTEFAPTVGDAGDLSLIDWSQYLEGSYQGVQMAESVHVRFENNERAFRVTARNDGRCWWRSALTPKKSAATLSPIVTLAARA